MCRVIVIGNQKGGVGKTTTTSNLGIGLAKQGKRVLLIDADAQGSLTASLGFQEPDKLDVSLATVMANIINEEDMEPDYGILKHDEGVDLVPGNIELSGLEVSLVNVMSRELVLRTYIEQQRDRYDYILIDCMPSLGMITINAFASADSILIPVQAAYLPVKGLEQLIKTIGKVKRQINPKLEIEGILLTMVDNRTNYAKDISSLVVENYGSKVRIFENSIPIGPLKIAALDSCKDFAKKVDDYIVSFRQHDAEALAQRQSMLDFRGYDSKSYLLDFSCPRFGSGEAKCVLKESVRGSDIFAMVDVTNYSLTYQLCGEVNHMSPDNHYQDLKRLIGSCRGARRVNVVMPFLYEGRQHKRTRRESLDCALALEELIDMGVSNIITFDAHDPRVQNAIPLHGFDNFTPPYQFIKTLLKKEPNMIIDKDHLMAISPDEGAMGRAVYFANNLGIDMGMFYKRRDYSTVVNGKNPIVAHEFLGANIKGKTVIIIDDMISSGESMLDTAKELKDRGAKNVVVCCTFGLFTDGLEKFDDFNSQGYFDYVITTNLNYRSPELLKRSWYIEADMSKFTAAIINTLNHDVPIGNSLSPTEKIQTLLKKHKEQFE